MTAPKYPNPVTPSEMDKSFHLALRRNIEAFHKLIAERYVAAESVVLDIAPETHAGLRPFLPDRAIYETLDIDPSSGCTYVSDLCRENPGIPPGRFDVITCTEVLEHTLDPFAAVRELRRLLKPGGRLFLSTPFNFRIHGPLPDCWRFTEHGLRALLRDFEIEALEALETADRPLMPIQYTVVARKPVAPIRPPETGQKS